MKTWPYFILVTVYGACVGSFVNVVVWRLPEGRSLWRIPSSCPSCGHRLKWYDNLPIIAYLALRGRCRYCKRPIRPIYFIMELLCMASYAGLFWVYYYTSLWHQWHVATIAQTWPMLIMHLMLIGALLAATFIDFKYFIIPISIPSFVIGWAVIGLPLIVWIGSFFGAFTGMHMVTIQEPFDVPVRVATLEGVAGGGLIGLIVANVLLMFGVIPRSFDMADEPARDSTSAQNEQPAGGVAVATSKKDKAAQDQQASLTDQIGTPADWQAYPHARREVLKECLFVFIVLAGMVAGAWLASSGQMPGAAEAGHPLWLRLLAGVIVGYLAGGGIVWAIRILGTLAFGKEAMGLGDVHLLGGIGAILGWSHVVVVFFMAPFLGLAGFLVASIVGKLTKGAPRVIPYGPYLAFAAVLVMLLHDPIMSWVSLLFYGD